MEGKRSLKAGVVLDGPAAAAGEQTRRKTALVGNVTERQARRTSFPPGTARFKYAKLFKNRNLGLTRRCAGGGRRTARLIDALSLPIECAGERGGGKGLLFQGPGEGNLAADAPDEATRLTVSVVFSLLRVSLLGIDGPSAAPYRFRPGSLRFHPLPSPSTRRGCGDDRIRRLHRPSISASGWSPAGLPSSSTAAQRSHRGSSPPAEHDSGSCGVLPARQRSGWQGIRCVETRSCSLNRAGMHWTLSYFL